MIQNRIFRNELRKFDHIVDLNTKKEHGDYGWCFLILCAYPKFFAKEHAHTRKNNESTSGTQEKPNSMRLFFPAKSAHTESAKVSMLETGL